MTAATLYGGAVRVVTTATPTPPPMAAPVTGEVIARVTRRPLEAALHGPGRQWLWRPATLVAWAGDAWRETAGLALVDGLDAFHRLGAHDVLVVLEAGGLYRTGHVAVEAPPDAEMPDPVGSAAGLDPLPDDVEVLTPDARLVGVLTNDARCYLTPAPLTAAQTASAPYAWDTTDARPLPAPYLARCVAAAWRAPASPAASPGGWAWFGGITNARTAFRRFLLTLAHERLAKSADLVARELDIWADDAAYTGRLGELHDLLAVLEDQFGDVLRGLAAARSEAYTRLAPPTTYDTELHTHLPNAEYTIGKAAVDAAFDKAVTAVEIARARFAVQASLDERGSVGLLARQDAFDGATTRSPDDARQRARTRLSDLLTATRARLGEVERELAAPTPYDDRLYPKLLGAQPVVDIALQWGFGLDVEHPDALTGEEEWTVWAPIPAEAMAAFRAELLAGLVGEPTDLSDYQVALIVASIVIIVSGGIVGLVTGSLLVPAVATLLTMGLDAVEIYLAYDEIGERAHLVHAVHGLPGYRDPDLVRDFTVTVVLMSVSWLVDVADVVRVAKVFAGGIVSLDHRFALLPWLRRDAKALRERARTSWDPLVAAARADAIHASTAGAKFATAADAEAWAAGLAQALATAGPPPAAAREAFLTAIDSRGGWLAVEETLTQLGAGGAVANLREGRSRLLAGPLLRHTVDQADAGAARAWTLTTNGDLAGSVQRMHALRADLGETLGPHWEHQLGLSAHLVVSPGDQASAVQLLRDLWPADWPDAIPPMPAAGSLGPFAATLADGFGGWAALGRQLDDSLADVQDLGRLRDERLYPVLAQAFTIRKGGSTTIASDLDVSVMFQPGTSGIAARMHSLRDFMAEVTGLSQPRAWRNAFDMELFVDPSLATFYERLPKRGMAFVLADHVFTRAAHLTEIMREGGELRLGFDLLAEYARREPFPDDLLAARLGPGGVLRTPRETGDVLLAALDDAIVAYDARLNQHAAGQASDAALLDQARRVSDVALAVAMNNDEAYFLAGATKTVMSIRDGSNLYRGLDVSLERLTRLHVEELRHTVDENWLAHVVPDLARVVDEPAFASLPLAERTQRLAKASFQLGKYGQMRSLGVLAEYGEQMGAPPALVTRAQDLVDLGSRMKSLRAAAAPERILDVLGELTDDERLLLHARRVLRDAPGPGPSQLSAADRAVLETGGLSPGRLVERLEVALRERVEDLVGPGLVLSPPSGVFPTGSFLGDLDAVLDAAAHDPLLSYQQWVASRVALRLARALPLAGSPDRAGPLDLDLSAAGPEERLLGVTPPPDAPLDTADLEHLGLDPVWTDPS